MSGSTQSPSEYSHGRRKPQVLKGDLYMFTALWMQESPWAMESTKDLNVVGSVFVLPNDRVLSADCTRQHPHHNMAVHGAIRPLIKYPDKVKGCQVYLTRKPCAHCVKMLVQAGVSKVFYLPLQLEMPVETGENKSVDALFKVSEASRQFYVPNISQEQIDELKKINQEKHPYGTNQETSSDTFKLEQKWDEDWINKIEEELDWQEFGDEKIRKQVQEDMGKAFEWFCQATFATGSKTEMTWEAFGEGEMWGDPKEMKWEEIRKYDPKEVTHLSRLAQMLSNRTDDPKTGVGCVIAIKKEIVSLGWNGFPSKALYANHPRGSNKDDKKNDPQGFDNNKNSQLKRKYPHVIHAAHNALLSRNERNLKNSVAYVNNIPGDDCMPMLYEMGVQRLVLPYFEFKPEEPKEDTAVPCFDKLLRSGKIKVLRYTESVDQVTSPLEGNVTSPPEENVTSASEENVTSPPEENVTSPSEENVTSPLEGNVTSLPDENVTSPPEENVASPPDENVTSPPEE